MLPFDSNSPLFKFEESLNSLNAQILNKSNYQFDLGNFVDSNFNFSTGNIYGGINKDLMPQVKGFIDDELRYQITSLYSEFKTVPREKIGLVLQKILTKNVLYIGTECERQDFIGIDIEYDNLVKVLQSEFMVLKRVTNPTLKNVMNDWEKYKPSIIFISCHGSQDCLFLQDELGKCKPYNNSDLVDFFKKRSLFTECVILSACESLNLGRMIKDPCKNVICINRRVDIMTTQMFCNVFMEYLNDHTILYTGVYENAFNHAKSYVNIEGLKDAFAFEYLPADLIGN